MKLESQYLENVIFRKTRLDVSVSAGVDLQGRDFYVLRPHGHPTDQTFSLRTTVGWRRLEIDFEAGKFAGALLAEMGRTDQTGRSAFRAVLADCKMRGAQIDLQVNGRMYAFDEPDVWNSRWRRFVLRVKKGQLELGTDDGESDTDIICRWTSRFAAAIVAIVPLEEEVQGTEAGVVGYPEGALITIQSNRYERDRRNRAAAISIHGTSCSSCGIDMGRCYGKVAGGFIEVHHVTPVSELTDSYVVDPTTDLVTLCPNCHAVAHRRKPPFSVEEIRGMLRSD